MKRPRAEDAAAADAEGGEAEEKKAKTGDDEAKKEAEADAEPSQPTSDDKKAEQPQDAGQEAANQNAADEDQNGAVKEDEEKKTKEDEAKDQGDAPANEEANSEAFYQSKVESLRKELAEIKDGSNERVKELDKALQHRKLRNVEEAQRMRELRLQEAEALYSYDVKAANESYQNAYRDVQTKLVGEVEESIKRLEALREGLSDGEVRSSSRKLRGSAHHIGRRPTDGDEATDEGAGGLEMDGDSNPADAAAHRVAVPGGFGSESLGVNFFMTEDSIFDDLRAIQHDWKSRAEKFISQTEAAKECVRVEDGALYYNEHILEKDQDVVCYTEVSKEQIQGTIQTINSSEVIVKLLDGSLSRVLITYLRSGRCTIGPLMDEIAAA